MLMTIVSWGFGAVAFVPIVRRAVLTRLIMRSTYTISKYNVEHNYNDDDDDDDDDNDEDDDDVDDDHDACHHDDDAHDDDDGR
jgi:UPF0716 family protein affecting phage T7 exclusion